MKADLLQAGIYSREVINREITKRVGRCRRRRRAAQKRNREKD
jgi:hypothetical protein